MPKKEKQDHKNPFQDLSAKDELNLAEAQYADWGGDRPNEVPGYVHLMIVTGNGH